MNILNVAENKESKDIVQLLKILHEKENEISQDKKNMKKCQQHAIEVQSLISMKQFENKVLRSNEFLQSVIDTNKCKNRELSYQAHASIHNFTNQIKSYGEILIETRPSYVTINRSNDKQGQIPRIPSSSIAKTKLELNKFIDIKGNRISGCCMLPDGKMAFINLGKKTVRVINLDGSMDFMLKTTTYAFDVAYISEDNTLAVTSGESETKCITIIDIQNKQIKKKYPLIQFVTAYQCNILILFILQVDKEYNLSIRPTTSQVI